MICLQPLSPNLKYISESNKIFHYTSKGDIKFYFSKYQNFSSLEGCLLCIFENLTNEVQWIQLMSHTQSRVIIKQGEKNVPTVNGTRKKKSFPCVLSILGNFWQKLRQGILLLYVHVTVWAAYCILHSLRENIPDTIMSKLTEPGDTPIVQLWPIFFLILHLLWTFSFQVS